VSVWNGHSIDWTKDCEGCPHLAKSGLSDICQWGIAFKVLVKPTRERHCGKRNRPSGRARVDCLARRQMIAENQRVEW